MLRKKVLLWRICLDKLSNIEVLMLFQNARLNAEVKSASLYQKALFKALKELMELRGINESDYK